MEYHGFEQPGPIYADTSDLVFRTHRIDRFTSLLSSEETASLP